MKNKKIYLIITPYFPSEFSHVGSYVYDQAKAINDTGHFVVKVIKLVSFFSKEKDYKFNNISVEVFRTIDFPFFVLPGLFNWFNSIRIRKFLKTKDLIDNLYIIHAHVCYPSAYLANAVNDQFKVRTIAQNHGIDALQLFNGRINFIKKLQYNFVKNRSIKQLNQIDLIVNVSKRVQEELHFFKDYMPKSEYVLYNGVDRKKFFDLKLIKSKHCYHIGCVANFWQIKDHISLIKAIELLVKDGITDICLRLLGDGDRLDVCKQYVYKNNLSKFIFFEKERKHIELNDFYNSLNLFVLPSYFEASACVLMEAWATDIPIISIKEQGISELIPYNEKNNLLADKKSPLSLKEKIYEEYKRKRSFPFDLKYDIKNTINNFLLLDIFQTND